MQKVALLLILAFTTSCKGQSKSPENNLPSINASSRQQTKMVKTQGEDPNISMHWNVHCSLQDKAGNLWFGTTGEGVYRFDGSSFTQFTVKDGLSDNCVWSILEDLSGNIWLGTDGGLTRYDGKEFRSISFTNQNILGSQTEGSPNAENAVWSILQDQSGTLWFGTNEDLYCYDGIRFSRFLDNKNILNNQGLQLKWIQSMLQDHHGIIWLGSGPHAMEGVIRYDGKSLTSSKPNGDGWIRKILEDKKGNIWFAGRHGTFSYDGKNYSTFTEKEGIGSPMLVDKAGNIWFDGGEEQGTINSEGIWLYDGQSYRNFNTQHGLDSYSVWSMLEDKNGNIWVGTRNNGLYRYDGKIFTVLYE